MKKKSSASRSARTSVRPEPPISEASIKRLADSQVFERGEDYYESGAIIRPVRMGDVLVARCLGSGMAPYRVKVVFSKRGVAETECDCLYDWGGACKHIVALLLTHVRAPETIEVKPPVETLLAESGHDEMVAMVVQMVDRYPELYGIVDGSGIPEADEDGYNADEW